MIAADVGPAHAYFAGRPVHIRAGGPAVVEIVQARTDRVARRWVRRGPVDVRWHGRMRGGGPAADGRYVARIDGRRVGHFAFHDHRYPIRGPHADRGGIGYFGAPRNGGRIHEGFDVNAACGTPLAAARGGRVLTSRHDPDLYGWLVIVHGRRTHRNYWYAHLRTQPLVGKGDRVRTGQRLGEVGATGNAASVGCHLHFEVHLNRVPVDPEPLLHRWDRWS
jgi:murein DD-endopeptidase MepM/ murein hydrolase activator NlpD